MRNCPHIIGVRVSERSPEIPTATQSVTANSRNNRPTTLGTNSSGMKTAISDTVSEITVNPICRDPLKAASIGLSPSSMWRTMISIMTIASSTTKPALIVKAIKERLSRLKPHSAITPNVPINDSGKVTAGISVAHSLRRNRKMTSTTRAIVTISVERRSSIEARIVSVRSARTVSAIVAGSAACRLVSSARMRSTVSTTLAPGWRLISRMIAGCRSSQLATRLSSTPSLTEPTSRSRTGAPSR